MPYYRRYANTMIENRCFGELSNLPISDRILQNCYLLSTFCLLNSTSYLKLRSYHISHIRNIPRFLRWSACLTYISSCSRNKYGSGASAVGDVWRVSSPGQWLHRPRGTSACLQHTSGTTETFEPGIPSRLHIRPVPSWIIQTSTGWRYGRASNVREHRGGHSRWWRYAWERERRVTNPTGEQPTRE